MSTGGTLETPNPGGPLPIHSPSLSNSSGVSVTTASEELKHMSPVGEVKLRGDSPTVTPRGLQGWFGWLGRCPHPIDGPSCPQPHGGKVTRYRWCS